MANQQHLDNLKQGVFVRSCKPSFQPLPSIRPRDSDASSPRPPRVPRSYLAFLTPASLPRARAVKMPRAAKAAQTSRAAWKLVTKVCCRAVTLVRGRLCACGEDRSVPAVAPPKAAKTVPPRATLMLWPRTRPVASSPDASP